MQRFPGVLGPGLCFAVRIAYRGFRFGVRVAYCGFGFVVGVAYCGLRFAHSIAHRGFYLADCIAGPGLHLGDRTGHCFFGAAEFCFCPACNPVTAGVRKVHRVVFCIEVQVLAGFQGSCLRSRSFRFRHRSILPSGKRFWLPHLCILHCTGRGSRCQLLRLFLRFRMGHSGTGSAGFQPGLSAVPRSRFRYSRSVNVIP